MGRKKRKNKGKELPFDQWLDVPGDRKAIPQCSCGGKRFKYLCSYSTSLYRGKPRTSILLEYETQLCSKCRREYKSPRDLENWWDGLPRYPRAPISKELRELVMDEAGYKCARCGNTERLELDHVVSKADGGGDGAENLQVLCHDCNMRKGARSRRYGPRLKLVPRVTEVEKIVKKKSIDTPGYDTRWCMHCRHFPGDGIPCQENTGKSRRSYSSNYTCDNFKKRV